MKSIFNITIPKPCHENWSNMTPKEKGRFCSWCSKTVIDFTKQSEKEIQEYLIENKNKRICGHFYKKQLDSIVIEIPELTFNQKLSFQKLFILALFFVMGTTLFSCKYSDGKKQKIENIVIVDTLQKVEKQIDSLKLNIANDTIKQSRKTSLLPPMIGETICVTNQEKDYLLDSISINGNKQDITEGLIEVDGEIQIEGDVSFEEVEEEIFGFIIIEEPPRFKEAKNLSKEKAKEDFNTRMQQFVVDNFNNKLTQCLSLSEGKYKIFTQFTIDETGKIINIKVRAPHPKLEKEVLKMFKKLPQFIPAKHNGKKVKIQYSLPISFLVE